MSNKKFSKIVLTRNIEIILALVLLFVTVFSPNITFTVFMWLFIIIIAIYIEKNKSKDYALEMVKCDCGADNPENAEYCKECGMPNEFWNLNQSDFE